MRDEYKQVQQQMDSIISKRLDQTILNQQWNYQKQVGKNLQTQPFKYQKVDFSTKVQFTDDIRKLIYNEKVFPQDNRFFISNDWQLAPVTQSIIEIPKSIPSAVYIRDKKIDTSEVDLFFGNIQFQGRIKGKANQVNYNYYYFNLRSNALVIYKSDKIQHGSQQQFYIPLNQTTYDYLSDATDFVVLKSQQKNFKIFRDQASKQLINKLQQKLLYYSFRGACAFRNQVPNWKVADYINEEIDSIGPIHFQNQNGIKQIVQMKVYKQCVGAFFKLLDKISKKRKNKAGQIFLPRWLKQQFRDLPHMDTWLSTNAIPPQHSLMSLKIKLNMNEKKGLMHSLKYVFPYLGTYLKRSLIVYQSQLQDQQCKKILQNISFPMHTIGFPNNQLSIKSLQYSIVKSSDYNNEVIDMSYNKKLLTINGSKILNLINSNPSIKKLHLKGCHVSNEDQDIFFDALSSNLALEELQIDYHTGYNESMVHFMEEFQAVIQ